ncbi:6262_t:CDS:10, partial [Ambispora leptoticha]
MPRPTNSATAEFSNKSRGVIKERLIEGRRYHSALNASIQFDPTKTVSSSDTTSDIANNIALKLQEYNQETNGTMPYPYTFFLTNENALKDTLNFEREFGVLSMRNFKGKIVQKETSRYTAQSDSIIPFSEFKARSDSIIPFSEFKDTVEGPIKLSDLMNFKSKEKSGLSRNSENLSKLSNIATGTLFRNSQNSFDNLNETTSNIAGNSLCEFEKSNFLEKSDKAPPKINRNYPINRTNRNTAKRGRPFSGKKSFSRITRGNISKQNNAATTRSLKNLSGIKKGEISFGHSPPKTSNEASQVLFSSFSNMEKQKVEPVVEIFVRNSQKRLKKDSEQKSNSFENDIINLTIQSDDDDVFMIESSTAQQKTNSDKTQKTIQIESNNPTSSSRKSSASQFPVRRTRSNTKIIQSTRAIVSSFPLSKKMQRKSLFMKPANMESTDLIDYFNFPVKDELAFSQYFEKSDISRRRLSGEGFNHYLPTHDTKAPKDQSINPYKKKSFNKENTRVTEPIDLQNMHQVIVLIEENPNILNLF